MTNFEKYLSEIKDITENGMSFAVCNGQIKTCNSILCCDCDLREHNTLLFPCIVGKTRWLCEENKEPIILTKKQRKFLEFVETGWLVRYESGKLSWHEKKPKWNKIVWLSGGKDAFIHPCFVQFPFIKSKSKEPYSVEEMLTWEVKNDEL